MKYMTANSQAKAGDLLDGSAIDAVASWADDHRRDHRETGPWHYNDCALAEPTIDKARDCQHGDGREIKLRRQKARKIDGQSICIVIILSAIQTCPDQSLSWAPL
jgi:hypothetical protein